MKLSRRDFVHAGCTIAAVTFADVSIAGINNPGSGGSGVGFALSKRSAINVNFTFDDEYMFINSVRLNTVNPTLNGASPFDGFSLNPFPQQIDQNGYINQAAASGQNVRGSFQTPTSANFGGPWVVTWDGDGRISLDTTNGLGTMTWTEANLVTSGTATFTNGNPSIAFANSFTAGQQVQFQAAVAGFSAFTVYYVIATGLSGTTIQLSATNGGAAIVPNAGITGTLAGTYTKNGNGSWTNVPGQKGRIVVNVSGITAPGAMGFAYASTGGTPLAVSSYSWAAGLLTVTMSAAHKRQIGSVLNLTLQGTSNSNLNGTFPATITTGTQFTIPIAVDPTPVVTPGTMTAFITNMQVYRQADEVDLLVGNIFRAPWKQSLVSLNPAALRFMNWSGGNAGLAYSFLDRTLPTVANWNCSSASYNWKIGAAYGRSTSFTNWSLAGVSTGTPSNQNITPASMVHGEVAQFQIGQNGTMGRGPQVTVTAIGVGVNPTVATSGAHNLFAGDKIWFTVTAGMTQINGGSATQTNRGAVTVLSITDSTHFVITLDTSAYGAFTAGFFTRSCDVIAVTAVTKAAAAQVTAANHGCSVGDVVQMDTITTGMVLLQLFPVTVQSVVDANNFTINVNTTGYPTWTSGNLKQYCTLQVGSGNDRTAYPIIFSFGSPVASFSNSNNYMNYGSYKYFRFDKTISGQSDGAGNLIMGAWVYSPNTGGFTNDIPIEVCTACINELNAMSVAQGINNPIHMYMCTTPYGIDSTDPDQTSAKRYGQNMVNVILNGANGYAGLTSMAHLFVEFSNETWNLPGTVATYMQTRGLARWPSVAVNVVNMSMFRATAMAIDIGNTFPSQTGNGAGQRVHRVLGGPPNQGSAVNSTYYQYWFTGSNTTAYTTDAAVVSGSWGAPGTQHEMYNVASYVDNKSAYYTSSATGTHTFNDDMALYFGTDNSGNGGGNYTGAANQTQAIQNFVTSVVNETNTGPGFAYYLGLHADASGWLPAGKFTMEYEGGFNWNTKSGTNNNAGQALTANGQTFMLAISNSAAWGTAQVNYFNSLAALAKGALGSVYIISTTSTSGDQRWAYAAPDSYASGIEGQALLNNGAWAAMSARNQALTT